MGQRRMRPREQLGRRAFLSLGALATLVGIIGCDRSATTAPPPTANAHHPPTVASLVPAATDLILGMNARDRLVAVSNYDEQRPDVAGLPRVGDYQTTDWETLSSLDPSCMVVQIDPSRIPPGLQQRAAAQRTTLLDVSINRLDDIPTTLRQLGDALQMQDAAAAAEQSFHRRFALLRASTRGQPAVPTLLVVGDGATAVAGIGTFLDDVLQQAGGTNAAASLGTPWPTVDREMLLSLPARVVIVLIPNAAPAVRAATVSTWKQLLGKHDDEAVFLISSWYALLPGWHVTDVGSQIAFCLHGVPLPAGVEQPARVQ